MDSSFPVGPLPRVLPVGILSGGCHLCVNHYIPSQFVRDQTQISLNALRHVLILGSEIDFQVVRKHALWATNHGQETQA